MVRIRIRTTTARKTRFCRDRSLANQTPTALTGLRSKYVLRSQPRERGRRLVRQAAIPAKSGLPGSGCPDSDPDHCRNFPARTLLEILLVLGDVARSAQEFLRS